MFFLHVSSKFEGNLYRMKLVDRKNHILIVYKNRNQHLQLVLWVRISIHLKLLGSSDVARAVRIVYLLIEIH